MTRVLCRGFDIEDDDSIAFISERSDLHRNFFDEDVIDSQMPCMDSSSVQFHPQLTPL